MNVVPTRIPEVLIFEPKMFGDDRVFFFESFNACTFEQATDLKCIVVQDNGERTQLLDPLFKFMGFHEAPRAASSSVVRACPVGQSPAENDDVTNTFDQWGGKILSAENMRQFWISEGFADDCMFLSERAEFAYKTTGYHALALDRSIIRNDATVVIDWPAGVQPIRSAKDVQGKPFAESEVFS